MKMMMSRERILSVSYGQKMGQKGAVNSQEKLQKGAAEITLLRYKLVA